MVESYIYTLVWFHYVLGLAFVMCDASPPLNLFVCDNMMIKWSHISQMLLLSVLDIYSSLP